MNQKEICLCCKWWKMNDLYAAKPDDDGMIYPPMERRGGQCRVNPPIAVLSPARPVDGCWPEVFGADWCGKFQNRPDDHESSTFEPIAKPAERVLEKLRNAE